MRQFRDRHKLVDFNGARWCFDLAATLFIVAVALSGFGAGAELGDGLAELVEPALSDLTYRSFGDDEPSLEVIGAIDEDQRFSVIDRAKDALRIATARNSEGLAESTQRCTNAAEGDGAPVRAVLETTG